MVRIFEIKSQEERRKVLVTLSGEYRRALQSEMSGIRSVAQSKFSIYHMLSSFVKGTAPVLGAIWGRKKSANGSGGFLSRLFSGFKFAAEVMGVYRKLVPQPESRESEERHREPTN